MPNRPTHAQTLALDRGVVEVRVDPGQRTVDLVPGRWFAGIPVAWLDVLAGISACLAMVVALAGPWGFGSYAYWIALALGVGTIACALLAAHLGHGPALRLDPSCGLLHAEGRELDLAVVEVVATETGWGLSDGDADAVDIGSTWGPAGASWLAATIRRARAFELDAIDLTTPYQLRPRPPVISELPVPVRADHGGIEGTMDLADDDEGTLSGPLASGLLAATIAGWLWTEGVAATGLIGLFAAFAVSDGARLLSRLRRRHLTRRYRHVRVRLDAGALHYVQNGEGHRVALADISGVHLGHRAIQVDLRDGTAFWLGHGWPLASLRELAGALDQARAEAPTEEVEMPRVPEALAKLRRATE